MDMTEADELDCSIVGEQGRFPAALHQAEKFAFSRLVQVEGNPIQWRHEAYSYRDSIVKGATQLQKSRKDRRDPGESWRKLWAYFSIKNVLTPTERGTLKEDPYISTRAR